MSQPCENARQELNVITSRASSKKKHKKWLRLNQSSPGGVPENGPERLALNGCKLDFLDYSSVNLSPKINQFIALYSWCGPKIV